MAQVRGEVPFPGGTAKAVGEVADGAAAARALELRLVGECRAECAGAESQRRGCCRFAPPADASGAERRRLAQCGNSGAQTAALRLRKELRRGAWLRLSGDLTRRRRRQDADEWHGSGIMTLELDALRAGVDEGELRDWAFENPACLAAWLGPFAGQVYAAMALAWPAPSDAAEHALARDVCLELLGMLDAPEPTWPGPVVGKTEQSDPAAPERVVEQSADGGARVRADGDAVAPVEWAPPELPPVGDAPPEMTEAELAAQAEAESRAAEDLRPENLPLAAADAYRDWAEFPLKLGPEGDAYRMMAAAAGRLLVAKPAPDLALEGQGPRLYVVPGQRDRMQAGLWTGEMAELLRVMRDACAIGRAEAAAAFFRSDKRDEDYQLWQVRIRYMDRAPRKAHVVAAADVMLGVLDVAAQLTDAQIGRKGRPRVLEVWDNELDASPRYMGFRNGVLDLDSGELRRGADAMACLVTMSTGVNWDPKAAHPDADAIWNPPMLDGQDPDLLRYMQDALAWSVRGLPGEAQVMNLLTDVGGGEGDAGKTTLLNAMALSLGQYGGVLSIKALAPPKSEGDSASPSLEPLARKRFVYIEEANQARLNSERFKAVTGGGELVFRMLYANPQQRYVLASIWGAANGALRLDLSGGAEFRRYRPIPMPKIPDSVRRPGLVTAFGRHTPGSERRRQAWLRLVIERSMELDGPPAPPQAVMDLAAEHRAAEEGAVGEWIAEHIVVDDNPDAALTTRLATADAWAALRAMAPALADELRSQRNLTERIRKKTGRQSRTLRIPGRRGAPQGWQGLRLSEAALAAMQAAQAGGK